MRILKKLFLLAFLSCFSLFNLVSQVYAREGQVLGVHILNPGEIDQAKDLIESDKNDDWYYVTIPLSLNDLDKKAEWQDFFDKSKKEKIIPIVRLATKLENNAWKIPSKKEIIDLMDFLSDLDWPTDKRYIIVFNEVNHAKEWGGEIDAQSYSRILTFTSNWAHTEAKNYVVLPAAMDLAAPNGSQTMEAFNYLDQMYDYDKEVFSVIDLWNSHSYPNPGFSSSPEKTAKNSLRGFLHELAYLKEKTGKDFQVVISETGWVANAATAKWLESYYLYAMQHIWSNPQVMAVTPFLLKGDPGPFALFGFIDRNDQPTVQYQAFRNAVEKSGDS
ncbi:MAG: hypothetical protein PVJ09_01350 [Candidatus Woesebacteria bacterium]|jgi:hypothetical protein